MRSYSPVLRSDLLAVIALDKIGERQSEWLADTRQTAANQEMHTSGEVTFSLPPRDRWRTPTEDCVPLNPYESPVVENETSRICRFAWWFSAAALLTYVVSMVVNRELDTVITGYLANPLGAANESLMILSFAGLAGWLASLEIDKKIFAPNICRRLAGGFAFGMGLANSQPHVFPCIDRMLSRLTESTPLDPIVHGLFAQPYVMLPTVLFAGVCGWGVERIWFNLTPRSRRDEPSEGPAVGFFKRTLNPGNR